MDDDEDGSVMECTDFLAAVFGTAVLVVAVVIDVAVAATVAVVVSIAVAACDDFMFQFQLIFGQFFPSDRN